MKLQSVALGETRDPIDGIVFGKIRKYAIAQNTPFAFPPAADFPHGGILSIRVPADGELDIRNAADGDECILDPGRHRGVFLEAESHVLVSSTGITISVIANAEVGEQE